MTKIGDIMVTGSKMNPAKQFFYVFDIVNGVNYMNGICCNGTLFTSSYTAWGVDRKADEDEIEEFYELLKRFNCVVDENLKTIRKKYIR